LQDLFHTELTDVRLGTTFNGLVCQFALLLLEFEDALLDGVLDCDFVDYDVGLLGEAVDAIDGLFFDELCNKSVINILEGQNPPKFRYSQDSRKAQG
jgi:hypothetical protein